MTRLRALANSLRPLTEVLVGRLRRAAEPGAQNIDEPQEGSAEEQLVLPLEDGVSDPIAANVSDGGPCTLRTENIAAAILLGRALDRRRDFMATLRNRDSIVIIEAPTAELVEPLKNMLRTCVLGHSLVLDSDRLDLHDTSIAPAGTVVLFVGKDDGKLKSPGAKFAAALRQRCAVIAVADDPDQTLPPNLVRLANVRVPVPPLDGETVAAVIEAVTGRHPGPVEEGLALRVTLETLALAVRADLGAHGSLTRLARLAGKASASSEPSPTLSELNGLGAARDWGLALIRDIRDYTAGRLPWSAVDRGCLLTGAPGTGKTTFARALAKEARVHFVATSYSQWQAHKEGHLGHVTQAIRNAFAEARRHAPAILFIDEIDTLPRRGSGKWNDDWWTSITNTLLEQLDGFERRHEVVVIAACNDAARLDPALVRGGRLDRRIEIPLPDVPALIGIFRSHLGDELAGADLRDAALAARGYTGADVERWVREARRTSRTGGQPLAVWHLLDAVRGGEPEWPAEVRHRIAYHEAGHAVAVQALGVAEPKSLSIGDTGGAAESDTFDRQPLTRSHLEQYLVVLLAGRASEELVFGEATAGAGGAEQSDLSKATDIAMRIESSSGLGALGLVCVPGDPNKRDLLLFHDLRAAVERTMDRAHTMALDLLAKNRPALDALGAALFAAGYLDRAEIAAVFREAPISVHTGEPAIDALQATMRPDSDETHSDSNAQSSPSSGGAAERPSEPDYRTPLPPHPRMRYARTT